MVKCMVYIAEKNYLTQDNTLVFFNSDANIGYYARTSTQGKELEMVYKYIDYLKKKYSKMSRKKAAIFVEPLLETGYPDIVVLEYYSFPNLKWNDVRKSLNSVDLKILFYIQTNKKLTIDMIKEILGYSIDVIQSTLEKLLQCKLIWVSKDKKSVKSVDLNKYCRISKIIAIEAKIDKWQDAIRQANNNIWFATESYVMMNKTNCSPDIMENCRKQGLGIITINGEIRKILNSKCNKFPVSYASLQFNEILLRKLYREEDNK